MARIDLRRPAVWIPTALGIALLALFILRVVQASAPEEGAPTVEEIRQESGIPVRVAEAGTGEIAVWQRFDGAVSGVRDAEVRARTGDQVVEVMVTAGDRVREGQVLVRQAGQTTNARVRQAEAAVEQARRTVDRLRPLHEAGAISDQELDQAETQLEMATADVAAARDALGVTSPLTGTVTEVMAREGMIPSPGDPLARVADLSEFAVRAHVSAADAASLERGQPARLVSGADGADGRVRRVALQADPVSRLVEVEVAFPPDAGLIAGTLATVEARVASRDSVVQIPRAAVRDGTVWVLGDDDRVTQRAVEVGIRNAEMVEIVSGLRPGERVVVEGGTLLSEDALVRIIENGTTDTVDTDV